MRLTTKGRFAVTALLDIATHGGREPVTLAEISERQSISLSYLEQLFGKLRRHGLVASVRGPGGGYRLARESGAITVADIVFAVDETLDATACGGAGNCKDGRRCSTHDLWTALNRCVESFLVSVTLEQLAGNQLPTCATEVRFTRRLEPSGSADVLLASNSDSGEHVT